MTFRKRRWDGKIQSWFRKVWNAEAGKYDFDFGWRDEPDDAIETFLRTRNPKTEGMIVVPVDEFDDDGPATISVDDLIRGLNGAK